MKLSTRYQIWTQSNNPLRSYYNFSVWPYDLEHVLSVALGSGIIFTKFDRRQLISVWIIAIFDAGIKLWSWHLTFDLLTMKVCGTSNVTWSKSVRNLSEIEQTRLNYWLFCKFLHTLCHAVTLTFDLLALNFYCTSGVMLLNSVQNLSEINYSTAELSTV